MTNPWPMVGRAQEQADLLAAISRRAPAGAMVAGPAGVGKTSLVRRCLASRGLPFAPVWVFGAPATASVPLGAFIPLLPELGDAAYPDRLLHEAFVAFRACERPAPPLLAVDDAHLLDDLSALLVHQLATVGKVPVVLATRTGQTPPEPLVDLWKDGVVTRIELGPLDAEGVGELLDTVLGGPYDLDLAHRLARSSAGNPLYLRELVTSARERGDLAVRGGTWQLTGAAAEHAAWTHSPRLAELVEARLGTLDAPSREALEILALGEPLDLDHLDTLLDADVLAALEERALVEVVGSERGGAVHLAHPVHGEVLRAGLPALRARRINRLLADAVAGAGHLTDHDRERVVRWRLAAGEHPAAADLLAAAQGALLRFDLDFARRCATDAHTQSPSLASAVALGEALILAKDHQGAEDVLATPAGGPNDDPEDDTAGVAEGDTVHLARVRAVNLYHWLDAPEQARAVLAAAAATVTGAEPALHLALASGWLDLYDGAAEPAQAAAAAGLETPRAATAAAAGVLGSFTAMAAGRYGRARELAARVQTAGAAPASASDPTMHRAAELLVLLHAGELDALERTGEALHRAAITAGEAVTRSWAAYALGAAALLRGRPRTAEGWFREAVLAAGRAGGGPREYVAAGGLLHAVALGGDAERAARLAADLDALPGRRWPLLDGEVTRARVWARAAAGAPLAPLAATLVAAAARAGAGGTHTYEAALLHDALRLGARDASVLERLAELANDVEGELMAARAAHARALSAAADPDPEALRGVADAFCSIGAFLLAAEAAADGAAAAERAGATRQALVLRRLSQALVARGEDPRTPVLTASAPPVALTPRELEIARLAASGQPSKAIAEELCLSTRTVDNCLGRVFAKLGTTSRAELADALDSLPE